MVTDLALVVLVDGEAAEPVGFGAVGGGGVLLHAAEDVAGHGCSDRGTEEHQEEEEADRRGSGGESGRGNAHALVVEYGEVWRLLCFVGGLPSAFFAPAECGGNGQWKGNNGRTGEVGRCGVRPSAPHPSGAVAGHVQGRVEATPRGDACGQRRLLRM